MNRMLDVELEQTDFPQVLPPWCAPCPAAGHGLPAAVAAAQRPAAAAQAALEAPVQSQPGATTHIEASGVKVHLWDRILLPEAMPRDSMVGGYKGKTFTQVGIKCEMISHYLGEFSLPTKAYEAGLAGQQGPPTAASPRSSSLFGQ